MVEFEINNLLGSHSKFQSVSAIYYSFPLAENSSKLRNIFLAALVKHVNLTYFGNDKCLESLVNEINIVKVLRFQQKMNISKYILYWE